MKIRDKQCAECRGFFEGKDILLSGLCSECSGNLIRLFSLKPGVAISKIHDIQSAEGNTPCFNTGKKNGCGQDHCEWQDICDQKVAESAI